jgi:hypothetical protein
MIVILTEFFSPIIAGLIYYFGWKKLLSSKAKQAIHYSFIVLGAQLIVVFLLGFYLSMNLYPGI